jgi:hypothetical protein
VEILVSLILLSVLGVVVWSGLAGAQVLAGRGSLRAATYARVLHLDSTVRQSVNRVRVPFWVKSVAIGKQEGELAIPYLDGEAGRRLLIKWQNRKLLIGPSDGEAKEVIGPFESVSFELLKTEGGNIWGISLVVVSGKEKAETWIIETRFGGIPGLDAE